MKGVGACTPYYIVKKISLTILIALTFILSACGAKVEATVSGDSNGEASFDFYYDSAADVVYLDGTAYVRVPDAEEMPEEEDDGQSDYFIYINDKSVEEIVEMAKGYLERFPRIGDDPEEFVLGYGVPFRYVPEYVHDWEKGDLYYRAEMATDEFVNMNDIVYYVGISGYTEEMDGKIGKSYNDWVCPQVSMYIKDYEKAVAVYDALVEYTSQYYTDIDDTREGTEWKCYGRYNYSSRHSYFAQLTKQGDTYFVYASIDVKEPEN